ncbi:hypothetical protein C7S14_5785 [Burkholderia cepacia]|nr:hypothetical protein C7S14_5785 [Burkholderia cepacia]
MAMHSQRPHPDVGLDVLDQVADVDLPVGIGQCGRNEDLAATLRRRSLHGSEVGCGHRVCRGTAENDGKLRF